MLIPQYLIDRYISKLEQASRKELKDRLKSLPRRTERNIIAERKAIQALLS
jgi:hypothetical protein